MKTIKIEENGLIKKVADFLKSHAEDSNWSLMVRDDGYIDDRHDTYDNSDYVVVLLNGYDLSPTDVLNRYPGDDGYDYNGVAEWIVKETDWISTTDNGYQLQYID